MRSASPLLFLALLVHASTMCTEGLLLGARQLRFLARTYAVNVAIFLTALYAIGSRAMGLRAVWMSLATFQFVRLGQFLTKSQRIGMLRKPQK